MSNTPINNNIPAREWLEKMADAEDGCDITAINPEYLEEEAIKAEYAGYCAYLESVGRMTTEEAIEKGVLAVGDTIVRADLVCPGAPNTSYVIIRDKGNVSKVNHHGPCGRA